MPVSEARKKANAKWNASQDSITIRLRKEDGAAIREAAEAAYGEKGLTKYILEAVKAAMDSQAHSSSAPAASLPLDFAAIEPHIEKTGETVQEFVARAVRDTIARDGQLFKMGLCPTAKKVG